MRIVKRLLLILHEVAEHRARAHVVAVDDRVAAGEVGLARGVDEERAVFIVAAVEQTVEVIVIVVGLHHGVVQPRVRAVEPRHHVAVLLAQGVEIDGNALRLLRRLLLVRLDGGGEFLGRLRHLLALVLLDEITPDLIGGEGEHADQHRQQQIIENLFHRAPPHAFLSIISKMPAHCKPRDGRDFRALLRARIVVR